MNEVEELVNFLSLSKREFPKIVELGGSSTQVGDFLISLKLSGCDNLYDFYFSDVNRVFWRATNYLSNGYRNINYERKYHKFFKLLLTDDSLSDNLREVINNLVIMGELENNK